MAQIPFIVVPKVLREHLGEDGAEALVGLLNQLAAREVRSGVETAVNNLTVTMAREFSSLGVRINEMDNSLRAAMQEGDNALRLEMREGFANLRTEMHAFMRGAQVSLIKWMFAFWLGEVAVILGILKLLGAI